MSHRGPTPKYQVGELVIYDSRIWRVTYKSWNHRTDLEHKYGLANGPDHEGTFSFTQRTESEISDKYEGPTPSWLAELDRLLSTSL